MMLNRLMALVATVAVLILLPKMWVSGAEVAKSERQSVSTHAASVALASNNSGLEQRRGARKQPSSQLRFEPGFEPTLIVKFRDEVKARVAPGRGQVLSRSGANLGSFQDIVNQFGLSVSQFLDGNEQRLQSIQSRAEAQSARVQPDLAGILRVTGPAARIEQAAHAINALENVEFIEFASSVDPDFDKPSPHDQMVMARKREIEQRQLREGVDKWDGIPVPQMEQRPTPRPAVVRSRDFPLELDSGPLASAARGAEPVEVFSQMIEVPDVPWIRLYFRNTLLAGSAADNTAAYIVVTSLVNGESQTLDAYALSQWNSATAMFRGGQLLVQLFVYPGTGESRVTIDRAEVGEWAGGMALAICDIDDERVQTGDPAVGRIVGGGSMCSGFLFNDNESCMLSASHCSPVITGAGASVHFNVPDSMPDGTMVPSAIVDQFPILVDSIQLEPLDACLFTCGSDWSLFGLGENTAGQTALQWQGASHTLATADQMPTENDDLEGFDVIVRGYGETVSTNAPNQWSMTQTEHVGPLVEVFSIFGIYGTVLTYRADTTGGTSGGPVLDAATGLVIGIHTCGGCLPFGGGVNLGTGIDHINLAHAFANPDACEEEVQGVTGSCCVGGTCFNNIRASLCAQVGGFFNGIGTTCPTGPMFDGASCFATYLCCLPGQICDETSYWNCRAGCGAILNFAGGDYLCDDDPDDPDPFIPCNEEPSCGEPGAGDCFTPRFLPGTADPWSTHCNQEQLCETVCEIDPFCCDSDLFFPGRGFGFWDEICVWHARRLTGAQIHPCFDSTGDCQSPNATPGCNDPGCCLAVCIASPACCGGTYNWDPHCVALAEELCALGDPAGPTPDFRRAQGYLTPTGYIEEHGTLPAGIAAGLAPWNGEFVPFLDWDFAFNYNFIPQQALPGWGGEGYDLQGLWEFGELLEGENLTAGKTISIAVLYPTAFVDPFDESKTHEDLRGRVIYPEIDQTMIINPNSPTGLLNGRAGTAVLGIIGANPENNRGMTGMAPDSELYFFPTVSNEQGGRFGNAMLAALEHLEGGDVIVIPYKPRAATITFASTGIGWTLLRLAADLGITCVIAAGDENLPVSVQAGDDEDGLAIVVGAVSPGGVRFVDDDDDEFVPDLFRYGYHRLGFSNYCTGDPCDMLEAVHVSGWGSAVATLGYGDLFQGTTGGEADPMRSYTAQFGGTAASTAQIGAIAARMQGLARQFWNVPLAPQQIRGEIALNGYCQSGQCFPNEPPGQGGDEQTTNFFGDWDLDAEPRRVGSMTYPSPHFPDFALVDANVFPNLTLVAEWIVADGFFDFCSFEEAHTVRGQHLLGGVFSICALDANYFVSRSMHTSHTSGPSFSAPGYERELDKITYLATGQIADVLGVAKTEFDVVTGMVVTAEGATIGGRDGIAFIELFDWNDRSWSVVGATFVAAGEPVLVESFPFIGAQQFVRGTDKTILVRVWVVGFPIPGPFGDGTGSDAPFDFRLDVISLGVDGFVVPEPGD